MRPSTLLASISILAVAVCDAIVVWLGRPGSSAILSAGSKINVIDKATI
jgi:hypothetical protein